MDYLTEIIKENKERYFVGELAVKEGKKENLMTTFVSFAVVLKPSFVAVLTVWILCLCGPHSFFSVSYNGIFSVFTVFTCF